MKVTPAQQRLLDRADQLFTYNESDLHARIALQAVVEKYQIAHSGMTALRGSADYRVAYALAEKGLGKISSIQPYDVQFFLKF